MKSTMFRFAILSLSAALSASLVHAQAPNRLRATIPFEFNVGHTMLPGGTCEINNQSSPALLQVRCGDKAVFALPNSVSGNRTDTPAKLVFHRYDNEYFLAEVWGPGGYDGRQLPPTSRERELIKAAAARSTLIIVASR